MLKVLNFAERHLGLLGLEELFKMKRLPDEVGNNIRSFIPKVLIIQINAGGVGLNLQQFNNIFITYPNWNPSNEIQAIARAHRIGQEKQVIVNRFKLFDSEQNFSTIDQRITNIQIEKRNTMIKFLEDENSRENSVLDISSLRNKQLINKLGYGDLTSLISVCELHS